MIFQGRPSKNLCGSEFRGETSILKICIRSLLQYKCPCFEGYMPVTLSPNPMYASGAVYIGGADGSSNASDTDGVDRSMTNQMYSDASGRPALSTGSEMQINRRIQEQKANRRLFGVGMMSAIALLLAIVAIATNSGGGSGDASVSSSSAGLFDGLGASTSAANATITNREYHMQLTAHVGWLALVYVVLFRWRERGKKVQSIDDKMDCKSYNAVVDWSCLCNVADHPLRTSP